MKALLDTNVLIDLYHNRRKAEDFLLHLGASQFYISPVTYVEFLGGAKTKYKAVARKELQNYNMLPLDAATEKVAYQIARGVELASGRSADLFIAAAAKAHRIQLVTANVRDFHRLPGIVVVLYEIDWK